MGTETERLEKRNPQKAKSRRFRWRDEILRFAALRLAAKAFDWIMTAI